MTDLNPLQPIDPFRVARYDLLGRLGTGGMGHVYLGRDSDGVLAAVKIIRPEYADDSTFQARFGREITIALQAQGRFVAPVVDADSGGSPPWMAVEYVPGVSLANAVARFGPLPVSGVQTLAAALATALAQVHSAGVAHRDLKPGNVMLLTDGPRIIDFGVARAADMTTITHTGELVGSPGFMAPEQVEHDHEIGPASDVFSLGALVCFAATGSGPFGTGPAATLIYRVVHHAAQLEAVPESMRDLVAACLAKDPADRPSAADVAAQLLSTGADLDERLRAGWLAPELVAELARRAAKATELAQLPAPAETQLGPARPRAVADAAGGAAPVTARRRPYRLLLAGAAVLALVLTAGVGYAVQPDVTSTGKDPAVDPTASSADRATPMSPPAESPSAATPPQTSPAVATPTAATPPPTTRTATVRPPDPPTEDERNQPPPAAPPQNRAAGSDGAACFNTAVLGGFELPDGVTVAGGPNFTSSKCRNIYIKLFKAKYRTYARSCLETPDGARITECSPWILLSFPDTWDALHVGVPANSRWQLQMFALGAESAGFYYTA